MKTIITCILATTLLFLGSCVSESNIDPLQELTNSQQQNQIQKSELTLSDEEFYALVQSIPSPLQVSALMEALGLPYDETFTVKTDKVDEYGNWFAQATNMGIYGADMGYANVYGEMKKSLDKKVLGFSPFVPYPQNLNTFQADSFPMTTFCHRYHNDISSIR